MGRGETWAGRGNGRQGTCGQRAVNWWLLQVSVNHQLQSTLHGSVPVFASFFVLFALANSGLPGTYGFVGEFMVILASFRANFFYAFLAATTLILGAAYSLWMIKRVVFGKVSNDAVAALHDVNRRELIVLASLAIMVLILGVWPAPLLDLMHVSVEHLLQHDPCGF